MFAVVKLMTGSFRLLGLSHVVSATKKECFSRLRREVSFQRQARWLITEGGDLYFHFA
jgi:hypothetical protein